MASRNRFLGVLFQPTPFRSGLQLRSYVIALGLVVLAWSLLLAALTLLFADRVAFLRTDRLLFNIASNVLVIISSYVAVRRVVPRSSVGVRRRIRQIMVLCLTTGIGAAFSALIVRQPSYVGVGFLYLAVSAAGYWFSRRVVMAVDATRTARAMQERKHPYEIRSALYSFGLDMDGYYLVEFIDKLSRVTESRRARRYLSYAHALIRRRMQLLEART